MIWDDDKMIAADVETSGTLPEYALQPWRMATRKSWITSFAACRKTPEGLVFHDRIDPEAIYIRKFLKDCIDLDLTIVGWNITFDIAWFIAAGCEDLVMHCKWLDGMLLWRHFAIEPEYDMNRDHKKHYNLKSCVAEFLPKYAGYEADIDFHSTDPEKVQQRHEYAKLDVAFTLRLAKKWFNKLTPQQLKTALIEAQCLPLVAKANLDGMIVDRLAARELYAMATKTADDMLEKLAPYGVTEKVVRSPIQLSRLMFEVWGLPIQKQNTSKKTGKTTNSTDKEVLHELGFHDERAKHLRTYREALGNRTKFAENILESADYNEDGRTRPSAFVFGTYSGRFTYGSKQGKNKDERQTGFAMHQMLRDKKWRESIIPPPGHTIVEFDAAGQEFRWMAIASGDQTMLSLCAPGEDAHSFMGAKIEGKDYREMIAAVKAGEEWAAGPQGLRMMGKVGNLSLQYRTSAPKLRSVARVQYMIPMELPQAKQIHFTYQKAYPGVPVYWEKQIAMTKRLGYVETFAGRRVQVVGNWDRDGWQMGSTAINYRIQGCLQRGVRVHTRNGLIPIEQLVGETAEVWTGFRWAQATGVPRGECQLAEITLDSGEVIRCDTRHKLKSADRAWVEFKDMSQGMIVALPLLSDPIPASTNVTWPYVIGCYIGDGWLGSYKTQGRKGTRRQFSLSGGKSKLANLERIQAFLASEGFKTKIRQTRPTVWALESQRSDLVEMLMTLGITPNQNARSKRIPENVWRMSEQDRRDFWEGVCDTDGAKGIRQKRNLHTPNSDLVQELQVFVSALGFDTRISATKNGSLLRVGGGRQWRAYPKEQLLRDLQGFVPPSRMGDCESIVDRRAVTGDRDVTQGVAERIYVRWMSGIVENYRYARITCIKILDHVEETFTLSVNDPLHQFVADGVIHKNTGADQKYLALMVLKPFLREMDVKFGWDLHDGLYFYVPDDKVLRFAVEAKKRLYSLPYKQAWGFVPPIELPWDCKTGKSWGKLKDLKEG